MKTSKEVLTGSFESSKDKLRKDANDHVFKFIMKMIKRKRKQNLKVQVSRKLGNAHMQEVTGSIPVFSTKNKIIYEYK